MTASTPSEARPSNAFSAMDSFQTLESFDEHEHEHEQVDAFASISPPGDFQATGPGAGEKREQQQQQQQQPFDPQKEYRDLLDVVAAQGMPEARRAGLAVPNGADLDPYQQLMQRERRVLDTVDRVVNDDIERRSSKTGLLGMSIAELCYRTVSAVRGLFDDLVDAASAHSPADLVAALTNPHRMPFLGVALVAVALLLAAMQML